MMDGCRVRLYEAKDKPAEPERDICKVVHDLQHIDTNCTIQAYGGSPSELALCLQVFFYIITYAIQIILINRLE